MGFVCCICLLYMCVVLCCDFVSVLFGGVWCVGVCLSVVGCCGFVFLSMCCLVGCGVLGCVCLL
jgi:hypothetical protein